MTLTLQRILPLFLVAGILGGCSSARTTTGASSLGAGASVDYVVSIPDLKSETFHVEATLRNMPADTLTINFPIWAPGAYDLVYFGRYIKDMTASSDGRSLKVIRSDSNVAKIIGAGPETKIAYTVDDIESLPNSLWFGLSDIEPNLAFSVGVALFGYPEGGKNIPYTVRYETPSGWQLGVSLDPAGPANTFRARDYDELADAPVQMGKFERFEFTKQGKPHIITVTAPKKLVDKDRKELISVTDSIVGIMSRFFGEMPYERYLFQHYLVNPLPGEVMFGALEHANSSTYRMYYSEGNVAAVMAPIIAHEYWHLWSPKRFHVSELGPFDYQRAPRTESLWFHEGITEYYSHLLLIRNGLEQPAGILGDLSNAYNSNNGKPQRVTITQVSRDIAEADPQQALALYSKGPLVALMLDVEIRTQSNNAKSLDDAMKLFNREYGVGGKTFTDADIIPIIERATGTKLQEFYRRYIDGTEPLPYDELMRRAGLRCEMRSEETATFGATFEQDDKGWKVATVEEGGSAAATGLKPGDVLTAISFMGQSASFEEQPVLYASALYTQLPEGVDFVVLRGGEKITVKNRPITSTVQVCDIVVNEVASGLPAMIRKDLLEVEGVN